MTRQRRRVYVTQIEGMAAIGLLRKYWVEDCDTPGMKRIVAEDEEGVTYETRCVDYRAAKKVILYLADASKYSRDVVAVDNMVEKDEVFDEGN
ncbi:hypothetical protein [Pyrodictium abyssi]|uniref:Uncharacterized protein n=1 Tax=Pyrodictium abyssi TaxID=54256 RepID=A0ABM8IWX9_9CREN|nr:hypothetical protein PABY_09100 [Pyrodictium abyssi]